MARHYYDVWCLITRGVAERAAQDRPLFDRVAAHREIFFRWSWVDYTTLHPGSLRFLPPAHHVDAWRKDYQEMRGEMFFGEVPTLRRNPGRYSVCSRNKFNQQAKSS